MLAECLQNHSLMNAARLIFNTCKVKDLPDVTNLKIDVEEPIINRARKYFMDIKNPYIFRVGDIGVKINCSGDKNLSDSIMNIVTSSD